MANKREGDKFSPHQDLCYIYCTAKCPEIPKGLLLVMVFVTFLLFVVILVSLHSPPPRGSVSVNLKVGL